MSRAIRVLIVDDSPMIRAILSKGLGSDSGIEVVGVASDPYDARNKIVELNPDVLTLDVEMPRMDGLSFLRRLMPQCPLPVVMVSGHTKKKAQITFDALEAGAVDFVAKPESGAATGLTDMLIELRTKIKLASIANVAHWKSKRTFVSENHIQNGSDLSETSRRIIAIGASTGGTEAIKAVITRLPANTPGIVITQHMPAGFTKMFADRLNQLCAMEVKEAASGDSVQQGRILIAPGDYHMTVENFRKGYRVVCKQGEKVSGHRPSVDVLMHSIAKNAGSDAVGIMLTGMGHDGAGGMLAMRKAGARTVAQNEATSVVFGMPKEAYENGGAEKLLSINRIAPTVLELLASPAMQQLRKTG